MRARRRILVADDDADIVKIVRANLEAAGFEIDAVSNGWEVKARALRTAPSAIVLDLTMPGRNGLEVLGDIRTCPETRDIPVVLLTACTSDTEIWEGWKAGASYYLTKPFDPDDLVRYVNGLFDTIGRGS